MRVPSGEAGARMLCGWFDFMREKKKKKKEDNIVNVIHILKSPKPLLMVDGL